MDKLGIIKKALIITTLILCVALAAHAGPVSDQMDQVNAAKVQAQEVERTWTHLEYFVRLVEETDAAVQQLADKGRIDLLPTDAKKALQDLWQILKDAKAAINANPGVVEIKKWRPKKVD